MKILKISLLVLFLLLGSFSFVYAQTTPAPTVTVWLQRCDVNGGCPGATGTGATTLSVPPDDNPAYVGIYWRAINATTCTRSGDWSGVVAIYPNADGTLDSAGEPYAGAFTTLGTHTYGLSCTGAGGTTTSSATLSVVAPDPSLPSVKLTASKYAVRSGESITLFWTSTNAVSCYATDRWTIAGGEFPNSGGPSGSQVIGPLGAEGSPYRFGIGCYGSNSATSPRSIITVTATSDAPVISSISTSTPSVGDTVIVSGSNFTSNTKVILDNGNTRPTATLNSSTSLSFVIPKYTGSGVGYDFNAGTHKLQLDNNGSLSNTISFNVVSVLQNTHLTIVEPGGYRTWKIGGTQIFKWTTERVPATATGYITFASAGYGGEAVINKKIADNIPNTGSFTWIVGKAADGSSIPASIYPYGFTVVMNVPEGKVSDYKDRTIILSNTTGETTPSTTTTTPPTCTFPKVLVNNVCTTPNTTTPATCPFPQILVNNVCKTISTAPPSNGQNTNSYNFGTTTLYRGVRGDGVMELQRFLNATLNLNLVLDGKFGPKTTAIVKQWQRDHGLKEDGRVGPKTKAMMSGEVVQGNSNSSGNSNSNSQFPTVSNSTTTNGNIVGSNLINPTTPTTPPVSTPVPPTSTKVYACDTTYGSSEATAANAAIVKLKAEAAQKDISSPLPKTSSGVRPIRMVDSQPIGGGNFVIKCVAAGFGGSPIFTLYANRVPLADDAMRWAGVSGETFGKRFDRLVTKFCEDKNGNFPKEYEFSSCRRIYEEIAGGAAGLFGFLPAGDIAPQGNLLSGETSTTQVLGRDLYKRLAKDAPLPVPARAEIELNQWKFSVSKEQWDLLLKRQTDRYNQYGCTMPASQMSSEHQEDLNQYPIGGKVKVDPIYQVGYGYEHYMTEFSRLNVCTLTYLGAKEINRLNPFLIDHSVPSVMQQNASLYNTHEQSLLYTPVLGLTNGYADSFYKASGYDWDNSIKVMDGLYYELVSGGKGGMINYCDKAVPQVNGRIAMEKALENWMIPDTMKQSHGSMTGCEVLTYDCTLYEASQCQTNYPSKYCGVNFQATWDKYCK